MREKKMWLQPAFILITLVLLIGWRYPQTAPTGWEYKIVPVHAVTQGEEILKDMDAQGWELIAVQSQRTQAELVPRLQPVQAQGNEPQIIQTDPSGRPEALYFFKRAKGK